MAAKSDVSSSLSFNDILQTNKIMGVKSPNVLVIVVRYNTSDHDTKK